MNKLFVILLVCSVSFEVSAAKIKIRKPTERKPSQESGEAYLANSTFVNFLKCSNEKKENVLKCVSRYFSSDTSRAMILRYSEALVIAREYTELFYCDENIKKRVELLEEKDYDFFLCFQSDMTSEQETGVAYFKKSSGMPKLTRLQM